MVERTGPNVRIGTLGASRIAPNALLKPASEMTGVEVTAVAARDPRRAAEFAALHNIPTVHDSYEALDRGRLYRRHIQPSCSFYACGVVDQGARAW